MPANGEEVVAEADEAGATETAKPAARARAHPTSTARSGIAFMRRSIALQTLRRSEERPSRDCGTRRAARGVARGTGLAKCARMRMKWIASVAAAEALGIGWAAAIGVFAGPLVAHDPSALTRALVFLLVLSIGLVEGGALSLAQASVLARRLPHLRIGEWAIPTVLFSVVGWGAGMGGAAFGDGASASVEEPPVPLVLLLAAAVGAIAGALMGAAQWLVLRHHAQHGARWIALQIPGWALAMAAIFAGFVVPANDASDAVRVAAGLAGGALGGALLGAVTAGFATRVQPWVEARASLAGKRALVTGASAGIGQAVCRGLLRAGASVTMVSRDAEALDAARRGLAADFPEAELSMATCDLGSHASIDALAAGLDQTFDLVVHDAGTTSPTRVLTEDGEERTLAVDVLGPMRLTEQLKLAENARIVVLTGIYQRRGHVDFGDLSFEKRSYELGAANAQAQRLRLLWVDALARRWPARTVVAVHPGAVRTRAITRAPAWARVLAATVARPAFVRAELGALPVLRLLIDDAVSGRFYDRFALTRDAPTEHERKGLLAWSIDQGLR